MHLKQAMLLPSGTGCFEECHPCPSCWPFSLAVNSAWHALLPGLYPGCPFCQQVSARMSPHPGGLFSPLYLKQCPTLSLPRLLYLYSQLLMFYICSVLVFYCLYLPLDYKCLKSRDCFPFTVESPVLGTAPAHRRHLEIFIA